MANELEETIKATENVAKQDPVDTSELEAKIKQLEALNEKLRQANTSASADASKWKKQYQEKLSEEDRKREEQEEQTAALKTELENLRNERNIANHKSQLLAIGFEDALAADVATAMNGGDTDKVFDGLRKFITAHDKALKESAFRNNPTLQGGGAENKAISKEQFDKMGYKERLEVFEKYPDLYQEYTQ